MDLSRIRSPKYFYRASCNTRSAVFSKAPVNTLYSVPCVNMLVRQRCQLAGTVAPLYLTKPSLKSRPFLQIRYQPLDLAAHFPTLAC